MQILLGKSVLRAWKKQRVKEEIRKEASNKNNKGENHKEPGIRDPEIKDLTRPRDARKDKVPREGQVSKDRDHQEGKEEISHRGHPVKDRNKTGLPEVRVRDQGRIN